jgi:hypothetical protein
METVKNTKIANTNHRTDAATILMRSLVYLHGLNGPGIKSQWGRDRPWGPPSHLYSGYRALPGGKAAGAWC